MRLNKGIKDMSNANPIDIVVGTNLRLLRLSRKMSQSFLGEKIGVTFQQIQKYERGTNRIGASRLWTLCDTLSCNPADFFMGLELRNEPDDQLKNCTDLLNHPRGAAMLLAFLKLNNRELENQIISLCEAMTHKSS